MEDKEIGSYTREDFDKRLRGLERHVKASQVCQKKFPQKKTEKQKLGKFGKACFAEKSDLVKWRVWPLGGTYQYNL